MRKARTYSLQYASRAVMALAKQEGFCVEGAWFQRVPDNEGGGVIVGDDNDVIQPVYFSVEEIQANSAGRVVVVFLSIEDINSSIDDIHDAFLDLPHVQQVKGSRVDGMIAITFNDSPKSDEELVQMCKDTLEQFLEGPDD